MIEITPKFEQGGDKPLYQQLYEHIKDEILTGRIKPGTRLPSVRGLSGYLGVSKNTVQGAYGQLTSEGYVRSRERSGLYVEEIEGDFKEICISENLEARRVTASGGEIFYKYDFSNGQIDLEYFPYKEWRRILNQCLVPGFKEILLYGEHQGDQGLRIQIARYLYESRGVNCRPEQILIGSGTQQSLSMLCIILKNITDSIAMEEPGYVGARAVFEHHNFKVLPVELEDDGINISKLKNTGARIVYITPSHQFPCGMVMSAAKRMKLLQWAAQVRGLIIEDDYDGEFRYHGKPIPSLQGLDANGNIIYLGTFSKSLIPSIRISYMVLPERVLNLYKHCCSIYEQPVPRINQKALQLFMEEGNWERHIRRMRNVYKKKHDMLLSAISSTMVNSIEIIGKDAGLHILLKVKNGMNERELIETARAAGVKVCPTLVYWMDKEKSKEPIVFLGFGGIEIEKIKSGIELLNKVWFG